MMSSHLAKRASAAPPGGANTMRIPKGVVAGGMAGSHHHTDAYMAQMYKGLEEMGVDTADDVYKPSFMPDAAPATSGTLPSGLIMGAHTTANAAVAAAEWLSGPNDPAGRMVSVSSRPLLCMSVHEDVAVVGSADHGLCEVDIGPSGVTTRRSLYTRGFGHTEWVTDVTHLPDG